MVRQVRVLPLIAAVVMMLIAGCGGGSKSRSSSTSSSSSTSTTSSTPATTVTIGTPTEAQPTPAPRPVASQLASKCPSNRATMGCAVSATPSLTRGQQLAIPNLPLFPDTSVWQGAVNWAAVAGWQRAHGWHPMAVFKLGEYTLDPQAGRSASETARLGFWRAGYWFVRNTGCAHEAGLIVWAAQRYGLKVVVEDDESPEARGYAACLTPVLQRAGLIVVEYTSPGTNPDSSSPVQHLWVAAYGPSHPPCVFTCSVGNLGRQSILAWQLTDGRFGPVVDIPGIGRDDVSVSYGLEKLVVKPKGPRQLTVLLSTRFRVPAGRLNERRTAARFLGAFKHRAKYRRYLRGALHAQLEQLAGRLYAVSVVRHHGWKGSQRGSRFQYLIHDAQEAARA